MRLRKMTAAFLGVPLAACTGLGPLDAPATIGEINVAYRYIPVDPLAVDVRVIPPLADTAAGRARNLQRYRRCAPRRDDEEKVDVMDALPDHTVRMAVRQLSGNASGAFAPVTLGVSGNSYEVIVDSVNADTVNVPFQMRAVNGAGQVVPVMELHDPLPADVSIEVRRLAEPSETAAGWENVNLPLYVGVGLRITAHVQVRRGNVGLSLPALTASVAAERASGTLTMQSIGIYSQQVSSLFAIPTELNAGTIQQALVGLGAVKAIMYDRDTGTRPRVTGIRNPLQTSDPRLMNRIYSELARSPVDWLPCGTA